MKKRIVAAVTAGVLAIGLVAGVALAKTGHQPTVTLTAFAQGARVVASGTYDEVSPACHGPGGRHVVILATKNSHTKSIGTTRTDGSGAYFTTTRKLKKGDYDIQSFVPGSVRSKYHSTDVCFDAYSNTVPVHITRHHHHHH